MRLPLPTTIVTGALGVGKTTVIASILARRPPGEKWAVLVNEFGALGIDGALLEVASRADSTAHTDDTPPTSVTDGVAIKQLAGGCMCCAAAGMLAPAVAMLIRQAKPDRLLIEPSGLGHPAGLIDTLQGEHLKSAIQLQAVICLVNPAHVGSLEGLYLDQVNIADVVVASKADLSSSEELAGFHAWAQQLYPPKKAVKAVARGELDLSLLSTDLHQRSPGLQLHSAHVAPHDHSSHGHAPQKEEVSKTEGPSPGKPRRHVASGDAGSAAGWVFSPEDVFQETALLALLQALWGGVERVKGVFRTGDKRWVTPTLGLVGGGDEGGETVVRLVEIAYRQDSRIEIIVGRAGEKSSSGGDHSGCDHAGGHCSHGTALPVAVKGDPGLVYGVSPQLQEALSLALRGLSFGNDDGHGSRGDGGGGCDGDSMERVVGGGVGDEGGCEGGGVRPSEIIAAARAGAWDDMERVLLRLLRSR